MQYMTYMYALHDTFLDMPIIVIFDLIFESKYFDQNLVSLTKCLHHCKKYTVIFSGFSLEQFCHQILAKKYSLFFQLFDLVLESELHLRVCF